MDFGDIERILELVKQHDLAEFELEREGLKLRIRKASAGFAPMAAPVQMAQAPPNYAAAHAPAPVPAASPDTPGDGDDAPLEFAVVKFVEVGQRVKKDQVLCIIEAMKLMNEITSEYEGEIVNIYVANGKPVQYGERLFAIRTM